MTTNLHQPCIMNILSRGGHMWWLYVSLLLLLSFHHIHIVSGFGYAYLPSPLMNINCSQYGEVVLRDIRMDIDGNVNLTKYGGAITVLVESDHGTLHLNPARSSGSMYYSKGDIFGGDDE